MMAVVVVVLVMLVVMLVVAEAGMARLRWDVNYAVSRLAVVFTARGLLSWVITMPMTMRAGGINDWGSVMRIVGALRRVVSGHCSSGADELAVNEANFSI
jgi:hypothetical protein